MKLTYSILILFISFQNLFCQVDSAVIILESETGVDTISKFKVSDFKTHFYKADLTPWTVLKDSGEYNNRQNLKNGFWKEYPIDTTAINSERNIKEKSTISEIYNPAIVREEGNYSNGKKNGTWTKYSASIRTHPFFWHVESITEYKDNMKNGKEILFEPFSKDTLFIIIYNDDEPIKLIE